MKIRTKGCVLVLGGVILMGLIGEARAELPVWLKKSKPGKFMIDTVDRSYLDMGKSMNWPKYSYPYYYRTEAKPLYKGYSYSYYLNYNIAARFASSYKTNLAYMTFTCAFTPKQPILDFSYGPDAYYTKSHDVAVDAYWKIYQQWCLRTYYRSYYTMQQWNRKRIGQLRVPNVWAQGAGTEANPSRDPTPDEWQALSPNFTYGVTGFYDTKNNTDYITIGLRWQGKAY